MEPAPKSFDITKDEFWSEEALLDEHRRIFDICHGCRRCYSLCPSFVDIFQRIDSDEVDGEIDRLQMEDFRSFDDLCYECKLCIPHCPYYQPHRWEVDVPRLVLRARAVRAKKEGVGLRHKILGNTGFSGKSQSTVAPLANRANNSKVNRILMEKTLGIHRDAKLPTYYNQTFSKWFKTHQKKRGGGER